MRKALSCRVVYLKLDRPEIMLARAARVLTSDDQGHQRGLGFFMPIS